MSDKPSELAILSKDQLVIKYAHAEFDAFLIFLKIILSKIVAYPKSSNLFAHTSHDGVTLASKRKIKGIAIQFMDPKWRTNHVICIDFLRSYDDTNTSNM